VAEPPLPRASRVPPALGGAQQLGAVLLERLGAQLAHLLRLGQHRAAHVLHDGLEIVLALAEEGVEEAGRAGVVNRPRLTALEQPAVVEEDVHELPEHVVERLHELLPDRRVARRRLELPLCPGSGEGQGQAAALAGHAERRGRLAAVLGRTEPDRDVAGLGGQRHLLAEVAPLAGQRDRGQRALADDDRVHELHRHVPRVRAGRRRPPERDQPPAAREALGHPVA
jgi:hypothetical protein